MSRPHKRHKAGFWLDFFACFLIPAYTLLFAGSVEWLGTNFSVLAVTGRDHYRGFFLWGLMAAGYFLAVLTSLARTLPKRRERWGLIFLCLTACACLGCALVVPYLPEDFPQFAKLHVVLAFGACALMMAAILLALLCCRRADKKRYNKLLWAWLFITAGSVVLFLAAGMVSSALEVFFTISAALLVRKLWLLRRREQGRA